MFKQISPETWERREHFEYFTQTIKCGYSLTAELDVTEFLKLTKNKGLRFYPSFVYCVSTVINHMKEFRMGISEDGQPGYWDIVHPSYTVFHDDDHTFSDSWTNYTEDFSSFYRQMTEDLSLYGNNKGIKARPGQPLISSVFPVCPGCLLPDTAPRLQRAAQISFRLSLMENTRSKTAAV